MCMMGYAMYSVFLSQEESMGREKMYLFCICSSCFAIWYNAVKTLVRKHDSCLALSLSQIEICREKNPFDARRHDIPWDLIEFTAGISVHLP